MFFNIFGVRTERCLVLSKSLPVEYQSTVLIGKNYYYLNEHDSAYIYLQKSLDTDNVYTKALIYELLYRVSSSTFLKT